MNIKKLYTFTSIDVAHDEKWQKRALYVDYISCCKLVCIACTMCCL